MKKTNMLSLVLFYCRHSCPTNDLIASLGPSPNFATASASQT